ELGGGAGTHETCPNATALLQGEMRPVAWDKLTPKTKIPAEAGIFKFANPAGSFLVGAVRLERLELGEDRIRVDIAVGGLGRGAVLALEAVLGFVGGADAGAGQGFLGGVQGGALVEFALGGGVLAGALDLEVEIDLAAQAQRHRVH